MKILMINGSPHPRGCTYMALHEMEQVLQAAGAETQILTCLLYTSDAADE